MASREHRERGTVKIQVLCWLALSSGRMFPELPWPAQSWSVRRCRVALRGEFLPTPWSFCLHGTFCHHPRFGPTHGTPQRSQSCCLMAVTYLQVRNSLNIRFGQLRRLRLCPGPEVELRFYSCPQRQLSLMNLKITLPSPHTFRKDFKF